MFVVNSAYVAMDSLAGVLKPLRILFPLHQLGLNDMNILDIPTIELAALYRSLDYPRRGSLRRDNLRQRLLDKVMEELTRRAKLASTGESHQ